MGSADSRSSPVVGAPVAADRPNLLIALGRARGTSAALPTTMLTTIDLTTLADVAGGTVSSSSSSSDAQLTTALQGILSSLGKTGQNSGGSFQSLMPIMMMMMLGGGRGGRCPCGCGMSGCCR
jgi:hypothetical protein